MDVRKHSQTSNIIRLILSNSTSGLPLTGLTYSSSGLIISALCDNEATATAYTVAASNIETISTLGTFSAPTSGKCRFKEVDATNHPGLYEIQIADARFSVANAKKIVLTISGATNLKTESYEILLAQYNPFDSVRLGLSALPNAAPGANDGMATTDGTKLNQSVALVADQAVNVTKIAGTTVNTSSPQIGVNVVNWKGSAAPDNTGDAYARLGAPAGASVSADIAAIKADSSAILTDTGTTLDGKIDAILEDTGSTLPSTLAALPAAVWNYLTSALTTAGSIGRALYEWLVSIPAGATAFGASDLEVCNNALVLLGNEAVANLTDTTKKAVRLCSQFYSQTKREVLRAYNWNCATVRDTLTVDATPPDHGEFDCRFAVPSGCLRVLKIADDQTIKFKVENGYILTNDTSGEVAYIKEINVSEMDALLISALSSRLASKIAFPLTNSVSVADAMYKLYKDILDEAQTMDAFEGSSDSFGNDNLINSRF